MQLRAGAAEKLLKAMASQPRLMILCELLKGERTVTELHQAVGLSMSAMSQHLARLREDELVATRRESQTIHYSLASEPAKTMIGTLYELFCSPAESAGRRPRGDRVMTMDKAVMAFAGFVVLVSLALAQLLSPLWLLLTAVVRPESDPGLVHRLLPGGDCLQAPRRQVREGLRVKSIRKVKRTMRRRRSAPTEDKDG